MGEARFVIAAGKVGDDVDSDVWGERERKRGGNGKSRAGCCSVVTCERRRFGFSGSSWEVRSVPCATGLRSIHPADGCGVELGCYNHGDLRSGSKNDRGEVIFTAKRTSREDGTLRWCDARGRLIATDTKLVRGRGNRESYFRMPVLTIVDEEIEQEVLDLLVASWLARVWVEVVNAKKKTLMDGTSL